MLLYNLESITLTKSDNSDLNYPVYRAFMKIFHIKDKVNVDLCQYFMHFLPVQYVLDARKFKYLHKLSMSKCFVLEHLYNNSAAYYLKDLAAKYNVNYNASHNKLLFTMWREFELKCNVLG